MKAFDEGYGDAFPKLRSAMGQAQSSTVVVDSAEGMRVKLRVVAANGDIVEFLEPLDEFPSPTLLAQVMLIV